MDVPKEVLIRMFEKMLLSRGKGHYIARGGDLNALLAEFFEKQTGCNRGKGGPMHIMDPSVGMLEVNGIVAASPLNDTIRVFFLLEP